MALNTARGLRVLKAIDFYIKNNAKYFDNLLVINKVKVLSIGNGALRGTFTVDESMCNGGRTLHGGYIASVIDVISFYALLSNPGSRVSWSTNLNINYLRSAKEGDQVTVEAMPLKRGSVPVIETLLTKQSGAVIAKGIISFMAGNEDYQIIVKEVIFPEETKRDAVSALPLEMSWKIFSYLDDISLRIANRTHKPWSRIIQANKKLRNRLNKFELAFKLGSESLAKLWRKNKRKLKKEKVKNYLLRGETIVQSSKKVLKSKRSGEDFVINTKRYKLF